MKTNTPLQEKEKNVPNIVRKTVTVGTAERTNETTTLIIGILVVFLLICFAIYTYNNQQHTKLDLAKNIPLEEIVEAFPTPIPSATVETKPKPEIVITAKKIEVKTVARKKIAYDELPGYHAYDSIILATAKKYGIKRPIIIKAIIEQESHYNPFTKRYEKKWEQDYGHLIKRERDQTIQEWRMNFHSFGLMQIGYALHREFCNLDSYVDLYNPIINIDCGTKLIATCIDAGNSEGYCIKKYNGSGPATEIYKNEVLGRVARLVFVNEKSMS